MPANAHTDEFTSLNDLPVTSDQSADRSGILSLSQVYSGSEFSIPANQRGYAWQEPQISDFISDLASLQRDPRYFGILVFSQSGKFQIIDGQQRITTLSLIACGLMDIRANIDARLGARAGQRAFNLAESLLFRSAGNPVLDVPSNHLLAEIRSSVSNTQLSRPDIFTASKLSRNSSLGNLARAYLQVISELEEMLDDSRKFERLLETIESKSRVICIIIDGPKFGTQLFESLNARGLELSTIDKVKNWLIHDYSDRMTKPTAVNRFQKIWSQILSDFEYLQENIITGFPSLSVLMHYFIMVRRTQINSTEVYAYVPYDHIYSSLESTIHFQSANASIQAGSQDFIGGFSELMRRLKEIISSVSRRKQAEIVFRLTEQLGNNLSLLWVTYGIESSMPQGEFQSLLETAEVFAFREFVIGDMTTATYAKKILKYLGILEDNHSVADVKPFLVSDGISNTDFKSLLATKHFKSARLASYILGRIDAFAPVPGSFDHRDWQREHIVPQSNQGEGWFLTPAESKEFKRESLNRIGNSLLIRQPVNGHIQNKDLSFKISSTVPPCPVGLAVAGANRCGLHYEEQSFHLTRNFASTRQWSKIVKSLLSLSDASSRFDLATELVEVRSTNLAGLADSQKTWTY